MILVSKHGYCAKAQRQIWHTSYGIIKIYLTSLDAHAVLSRSASRISELQRLKLSKK